MSDRYQASKLCFLFSFSQQTEILKFVFVTYFRVLKTVGHSPLLSSVLEGLAKFAHLINVDFFSDLMAALQTLLNNKVHSGLVTCMVACMIVEAKGIISRLLVMNRNRKYFYHFVLALPDEDQFPF